MEKSGKLLVLAVLKPKGNYDDFGVQEIKSLFAMVGIDPVAALRPEIDRQTAPKPSTYRELTAKCLERKYFVMLEIPHDQIHLLQEVVDRSVMVRTFLMLIGQGKTTEDLITKLDMDKFEKETASTESFCFFVTATLRSIKYRSLTFLGVMSK